MSLHFVPTKFGNHEGLTTLDYLWLEDSKNVKFSWYEDMHTLQFMILTALEKSTVISFRFDDFLGNSILKTIKNNLKFLRYLLIENELGSTQCIYYQG